MRISRIGRVRRSLLAVAGVASVLGIVAGTSVVAVAGPTPVMEATPANLVFGGAPGVPAGPLTAVVKNTGAASVTITGVSIVGTPEFAVWPAGTCTVGLVLAPADVCNADVMFTPLGSAPATATLHVESTAGAAIVGLFGNGATPGGGGPPVTYSPGMVDFGVVPIGTTALPQPVRVTNVSGGTVTIDAFMASGNPGFHALGLPPGGVVLAPSSFFDVFVEFTSIDGSPAYGQATISTSVAPLVVQLFANGAAPGGGGSTTTASINPESVSFGTQLVGTTGPPQWLTVTNTGVNPLTFTSPPSVPDGYVLTGGTCGMMPTPVGASCSLGVAFAPTEFRGYFGGGLQVFFNGGMVGAGLYGQGVVLQPGAGSAGGGYAVPAGLPNVERNRDRFEWALRVNGDGTVRGKEFTYRWWTGSQAWVARVTAASMPAFGLLVDGNRAWFSGFASVATVTAGVETPVLGTFIVKVESFDNGNPAGAGKDAIVVMLMDEATKTTLHQTGAPGSPATITSGNIGNGYPWPPA